MTFSRSRRSLRPAVSLLEVLISLTIFLIALIGLGQLVSLSSEQAEEMRLQTEGSRLAESKLAEVLAGVVSLNGESGSFEDDSTGWDWVVESEPNSIPNLYRVTVRVSKPRPDGSVFETTLSQFVLDPAAFGTLDPESNSSSGSTAPSSTPMDPG